MAFRIYTKTGDEGLTGLLGGTRVPKHHARIEAYGTLDELNSHLGMLMDVMPDTHLELPHLGHIQAELFAIGAHLAADPDKNKSKLPPLDEAATKALEDAIDAMDDELPALKSFVLPGGNVASSQAHIARTVCRRAERHCTHLQTISPIREGIIPYVNRLSDYLFTLGRHLLVQAGGAEREWHPRAEA